MNLEARILMRQMNEEIKWTGWRNSSASGEQIILLENMADLAVFFLLDNLRRHSCYSF